MSVELVIGWIATILTTSCNLPQSIKVFRTGRSEDISYVFILFLLIGMVFWLSYSILINDVPLMVTNIIGLVTTAPILLHKLIVQNNRKV